MFSTERFIVTKRFSQGLTGNNLEELLTKIKVDSKLLEETALTKQSRARSHGIRKANIQGYRIQSSDDEINAMEIRHFFGARYALEGQLWRCCNLDAEHATNIRME
jgi:hypothetical protein